MINLGTPEVTVIVPTFNDAGSLRLCVEALKKQSLPAEKYEIIVVDNGSDETNLEILRKSGISFLTENQKPGSYAARNKGIRAARGRVLAFTDSDCIPDQDWLCNGVASLSTMRGKGLVGGRIELFFKSADKPTPVELYESLYAFRQQRSLERQHYVATANMFTSRDLFDEIGLFDDRLFSSGDYEWARRVFAKGYALVYAESALVRHPARHSFAQLRRKLRRIAGGRRDMKLADSRLKYMLNAIHWLVPPLMPIRKSIRILFFEKRLRGASARLAVVRVLFYKTYVQFYERLKLAFGASAVR